MSENPLTWWKTNGVAISPLIQKRGLQYMQISATCMTMELITTSIHKNSWILDSQ